MSDERFPRVRVVPGGPIMVQGPVNIELPDGDVVCSERFMVAICTCRRSKIYPLCDTSHRRGLRTAAPVTPKLKAKSNASTKPSNTG
jgi:CDGSH-type Zn-finger protein